MSKESDAERLASLQEFWGHSGGLYHDDFVWLFALAERLSQRNAELEKPRMFPLQTDKSPVGPMSKDWADIKAEAILPCIYDCGPSDGHFGDCTARLRPAVAEALRAERKSTLEWAFQWTAAPREWLQEALVEAIKGEEMRPSSGAYESEDK